MPPRLPDLFIVGAPKCGTTALTRYLEGHPQVFMAGRKDLHHFGSDLQMRHRPCADRAAYLQHFAGAGPAHLRLGDSSVWYLYSQRAAAEIAAFNPQARPIILLREPVSMMYALWGQLRYNSVHDEDIDDFALAMAAEADRAVGRRLPPRTPLPEGLLYRRVASFAEQVDRYFRAFGRERVLVLLQDDLKTDAEGTWGRVLDFLGLDRGFTPSLDAVNTAKEVRSPALRQLLAAIPDPLKALLPEGLRASTRRLLRKANSRHAERQPLDPALAARLRAEMAGEVDRLEALLGRDLSRWRSG